MVEQMKDRFRALFEDAPNGVLAVDTSGVIVLVNAQIEKMFGYCRDELIGRPMEMLMPARFQRSHVRCRKQFAAAPQMRSMGAGRELRGLRKDGSECCLDIGINALATSEGEIFTATIVDVTERRRAQERERLLERARTILETLRHLGIPAVVLHDNCQVLLQNETFQKLRSHMTFRGDRIELLDGAANELLAQAVASLSVPSSDKLVQSIPIPATNEHPPMIAHFLPIMSADNDMFWNSLGILVVNALTTGDLTPGDLPLTELLHSLFLLTPAEARLVAHIGAGLSPRDAAAQLGISEETARSTLKHVFVKVGISRQSELAVLLTKLVHR